MEQNQKSKQGLYTRILRFFLRDLYNRLEASNAESRQLSEALTASNEHISEQLKALSDRAQAAEDKISRAEIKFCELLQASNDGHCERAERSEHRLDSLEIYREDTLKRMESDDNTTISLAHRIEIAETILQDNGLMPRAVNLFDKKTYSQSGEDAIIMYVAAMLGIPLAECNYLDLGANRPREMSNTYFFYEQGARGVLVEANCSLVPDLEEVRPGDIVLNKCITDRSGDTVTFNVLNLDGLSKIGDIDDILKANPEAKLEKAIDIETITVNDIIQKYFGGKAPVILNLDIEGLEKQILDSIDFETCRPLIMIIEMIPYSTSLTVGIKDNALLSYVESKGYCEYAFTGINSIFIDERKWREIIANKDSRKEESAGI